MEILFVGFFWTFIITSLIYLIIRRIKIYKTENFEKRDN